MKGLVQDWQRFWFAPEGTAALGLFRILVGIVALCEAGASSLDLRYFYGAESVLPADMLGQMDWDVSSTPLRWVQGPVAIGVLMAGQMVAAVLFALGLWTRVAAVALFVLYHSFHAGNLLISIGGDKILHCLLFLCMFAPAGARLSLDALRGAVGAVEHAPWALRMIQIQITVVYLLTGFQKLFDPSWYEGEALYYTLGTVMYQVWGIEQLLNWPLLWGGLTYMVLVVELAIPVLLWTSWRRWGLLLCLGLQGYILCTMVLGAFPLVMLACIVPFLRSEEVDVGLAWIRGRWGGMRRGMG